MNRELLHSFTRLAILVLLKQCPTTMTTFRESFKQRFSPMKVTTIEFNFGKSSIAAVFAISVSV